MDIFALLEDDAARIAKRLKETSENYSTWTMDRVFEETKRWFKAVENHFEKIAILENNLKNPDQLTKYLSDVNKQRDKIKADIEQIVEVHVDEPGFEQALVRISDEFSKFADYCKNTFFPKIKNNLSGTELKHVEQQIEQKVLS